MGNSREFILGITSQGQSEYETIGPAKTFGGIKGRLIKRRVDPDHHTTLPKYSKTSDVYFRQNKNGVCQARVYTDRRMILDFDWSHNHTNKKENRTFRAGTIHVQVWRYNKDGSFVRISDKARLMNNYEMKKYGALIKAFCPDVKFR
mgnify:CR=1 FL=1